MKNENENTMSTVEVWEDTTVKPISLVGKAAGVCWGADITDLDSNYKRGLDCIKSNHGRTMEFPQIYLVLDGWSAKVIRELYTHIGGAPTRLQASTRYIDYSKGFDTILPPSIEKNEEATRVWGEFMDIAGNTICKLKELGIPNEDATNVLPIAYSTKIVFRTNLRNLVDMATQRMCNRAYWEFRKLFKEILWALENYSEEWEDLIYDLNAFKPKCEVIGYCPEKKGCGKVSKNR